METAIDAHREILGVIAEAVAAESSYDGAVDEATPLFGDAGVLDSLGLVNVILAVEEHVETRTGLHLTISDDRAVSLRRSPFATAGSLAAYVVELIDEARGSSDGGR